MVSPGAPGNRDPPPRRRARPVLGRYEASPGARITDLVRLAQTLHGWAGVLGAALLVHPALGLRALPPERPLGRGARWSMGLAAVLVSGGYVAGWLLYPGYRAGHKRELLAQDPLVARLFESKEHLAWYTLVLCLGGLVAASGGGAAGRRTGAGLFAAAALTAVGTAALGAVVGATGGR